MIIVYEMDTLGNRKAQYLKTEEEGYYIRVSEYYDDRRINGQKAGIYVNAVLLRKNKSGLSYTVVGEGYKTLVWEGTRRLFRCWYVAWASADSARELAEIISLKNHKFISYKTLRSIRPSRFR